MRGDTSTRFRNTSGSNNSMSRRAEREKEGREDGRKEEMGSNDDRGERTLR